MQVRIAGLSRERSLAEVWALEQRRGPHGLGDMDAGWEPFGTVHLLRAGYFEVKTFRSARPASTSVSSQSDSRPRRSG